MAEGKGQYNTGNLILFTGFSRIANKIHILTLELKVLRLGGDRVYSYLHPYNLYNFVNVGAYSEPRVGRRANLAGLETEPRQFAISGKCPALT